MDRTRRTPIVLFCSECQARNYRTTKRAGTADKAMAALKKFCKQCKKHTVHRETK